MELIDTHAHLSFGDLRGQVDAVIERAVETGVTRCVTVATEPGELDEVIGLAERYECVFAAIGYHPHVAKDIGESDFQRLRNLTGHPKVVAIGETGLDFHYNFSAQSAQREVFIRHLEIAAEAGLPVIIHSRNAFDDVLAILDKHAQGIEHVVFHCFSEAAGQAQVVLDKGWHVSFTGVVTFKNAGAIREAAKVVPLERMMIETDCPYMSPEPKRNTKPNEPALLIHTARFLADLKGIAMEDFAARVTETSKGFFKLP
jgi:TatD DNase family protein